ncbi:MAG: PIG-L family deacetylase [Actinomycetota bacterium]
MRLTTAGYPDPGTPEDRVIKGRGTSAAQWMDWPGWAGLRVTEVAELVPDGRRLVVVAPHPDDEILGSGGLLAAAARSGHVPLIVAVTDGQASHPGSTLWPERELVAQRRGETSQALRALGAADAAVLRLGFADGGIGQAAAALTRALAGVLTPADVVVSPWRFDGHPDHEATGQAVARAAQAAGARHLEAPIWTWHWAGPGDARVPWSRAVVLYLGPILAQRKRAAIECFTSQLERDPSTGADPILPPWAVARFRHGREVFFR